jgi:RNA polymerase sigma-70 factor (ECF subfamily)
MLKYSDDPEGGQGGMGGTIGGMDLADRPANKQSYRDLLRYARKVSRRADEAEDLLQDILLAAVKAGRADMTLAANRRWLTGAMRKHAMFQARCAVRRRSREAAVVDVGSAQGEDEGCVGRFVQTLPPGLRTTALLALAGQTKPEIAWLLRLSDATLRQRIAQIRKRWRAAGMGDGVELSGLGGTLAFGRIRQGLLPATRQSDVVLASHDPDGHLFVVSSQNAGSRQPRGIDT